MQRWEYILVTLDDKGDRVQYINGKELPNWKTGPDLYTYLNTLGSQGWELVAAPYTEIAYGWHRTMHGTDQEVNRLTRRFIFKRPLP